MITIAKLRDFTKIKSRLKIADYMVKIMTLAELKESIALSLIIKNNIATVTYNGSGFGIEELKVSYSNSTIFGCGKSLILNCKEVSFTASLRDTWSVPVLFQDTAFVTTAKHPIDIERWLTAVLEDTGLSKVENSDVVSEIVFNSFYHRELKFSIKLILLALYWRIRCLLSV